MLDHAVFQVLRDVLLRDPHGRLRATSQDLETLKAISRCSNASAETRAFAQEMWERLNCPGAHALNGKTLPQSIEDALRGWRQWDITLLNYDL